MMPRLLSFLFCVLIFTSCAGEKSARFSENILASSRAAREGKINFSKSTGLEYRFNAPFLVPPDSSLRITYGFNHQPPEQALKNYSFTLSTGTASWELPLNPDMRMNLYDIPIDDSFDGYFNIVLIQNEKIKTRPALILNIHSIGFENRSFGFFASGYSSDSFGSTPFVYKREYGYEIDVPPSYWQNPAYAGLIVDFTNAQEEQEVILEFAGLRLDSFPGKRTISFSDAFKLSQGKAKLYGKEITSFIFIVKSEPVPFPQPIRTDPGIVINWPKSNWRNRDYEVFAWDDFYYPGMGYVPPILIFDYADTDVQDRMLKRLAFFVEKTGFRGRLAYDAEIADLHAWNAHDYRAEDLARFYEAARQANFPLLDEELQLKQILINEGIIIENQGRVAAGEGAIVSVPRRMIVEKRMVETPEYLRYQFMAHECYHGLFFIDEDFRNFTQQRWDGLSAPAKRFITSYFEFQQYDVKDEYLLVNEFMGHIMQQSVSGASRYFGQTLPKRLEETWRASHLPPKDQSTGTWPLLAEAFTEEARAFSAYVKDRWGLVAGRVWGVRIQAINPSGRYLN
jgi:hypothetical protein